jgi:hypothetical protein
MECEIMNNLKCRKAFYSFYGRMNGKECGNISNVLLANLDLRGTIHAFNQGMAR